jgi:hypothetical protein
VTRRKRRSKGLSCVRGNPHAQFLGGWKGAIPSGYSVQAVPKSDAGHGESHRKGGSDVGHPPFPRLLFGNDLRGLPGWRQLGQRRSGDSVVLDDEILQVSARRTEAGVPWKPERRGIMTSMLPDPPRIRLHPASYDKLRKLGPASRWPAMSIMRHDVKLGNPPQTVSQPIWSGFRGKPNYSLYKLLF